MSHPSDMKKRMRGVISTKRREEGVGAEGGGAYTAYNERGE